MPIEHLNESSSSDGGGNGVDSRFTARWLYICVFASGCAGLIYEVVWARLFSLFIGSTGYAHSAVITAFMTGLALGSIVFGKISDRIKHPLVVFAVIEIVLGVYAALTPWIYSNLQVAYGGFAAELGIVGIQSQLLRYFLALAGILIPTFFMGGTLPLLVKGLTPFSDQVTTSTARLYGLNTLGATAGAFLAGYFLIPMVGIKLTVYVGVALDLFVGLILLLGTKKLPRLSENYLQDQMDATAFDRGQRTGNLRLISQRAAMVMLIAFGLSGFAAMMFQLIWIKSLILIIGASIQAFSIILTTFLAGIGLGSYWCARAVRNKNKTASERLRLSAHLQFGIGVTALLGLLGFRWLPELFAFAYSSYWVSSYAFVQTLFFLFAAAIVFLPTLFMGMVFPLIAGVWVDQSQKLGQGVGVAYAVNSLGTITGASLGGLLILPLLGIERSLFVAVAVSLVVALVYFWIGRASLAPQKKWMGSLAMIVLPLLLLAVLPRWNNQFMQSGPYIYGNTIFKESKSWFEQAAENELLYYAEGADAVVSVVEGKQRYLKVNGKTDATNNSDMPTQIMVGQIPAILHPEPKNALIIGMGSGVSAASVATHRSIESLDIVEISEKVIEASNYFRDVNHDVIDDPRVTVHRADARNFLFADQSKYDVIVSEPSNPWMSGASKLFTRDYYQLLRDRLSDDGIISQWVHTYTMSQKTLASLLATFYDVFPNAMIWRTLRGDLVLTASSQSHQMEFDRFNAMMSNKTIADSLARAGVSSLESFVGILLVPMSSFPGLESYPFLNTDDRPRVEYSAPRALYSTTKNANLEFLMDNIAVSRFSAPINNLHTRKEDVVSLPIARLRIEEARAMTNIGSVWKVDRQLAKLPNGNKTVGVRDQVHFVWHEGRYQFQVLTTLPGRRQSSPDLAALLAKSLIKGVEKRGQLQTINLGQIEWGHGAGPGDNRFAIGIAWKCKAPGAALRYYSHVALAFTPRLNQPQRNQVIKHLANRFRCMY